MNEIFRHNNISYLVNEDEAGCIKKDLTVLLQQQPSVHSRKNFLSKNATSSVYFWYCMLHRLRFPSSSSYELVSLNKPNPLLLHKKILFLFAFSTFSRATYILNDDLKNTFLLKTDGNLKYSLAILPKCPCPLGPLFYYYMLMLQFQFNWHAPF